MNSNEERREIAARLRNYESLRESFRESPICAFLDALGVEYLDWKGVCSRLSDLIEPEPEHTCKNITAERTCTNSYKGGCTVAFKCSSCGDSVFYPKKWSGKHVKPKYCPSCGAKVVE